MLPFIHGSTEQRDTGNRAVRSFRRGMSELLAQAQASGTNWGYPLAMARAIEI